MRTPPAPTRDDPPARLPRVGVVDADRRVRQSLAELLRAGGLSVAGVAADPSQAVDLVRRHRPDVLVVDPRLPTSGAGAALIGMIRRNWPATRIVLIGWREEADEAGVPGDGYVSKAAAPATFVRAIRAAVTGLAERY